MPGPHKEEIRKRAAGRPGGLLPVAECKERAQLRTVPAREAAAEQLSPGAVPPPRQVAGRREGPCPPARGYGRYGVSWPFFSWALFPNKKPEWLSQDVTQA